MYYLRDRKGKSARITEKTKKSIGVDISEQTIENETVKVDEVIENKLETDKKKEEGLVVQEIQFLYLYLFVLIRKM